MVRLSKRKHQMFATFELLGKDLFILAADARSSGCSRFATDAIKKVAIDILSAFIFLHDIRIFGRKTVHRDVKGQNIAMVMSTKTLCQEMEQFLGSKNNSIDQLRMQCQRKYALKNMEEVKGNIKSWIHEIDAADPPKNAPLFKLIDLDTCTVSFF